MKDLQTTSSPVAATNSASDQCVDYDIHGIVTIRLINCPPQQTAALAGTFGPLQSCRAGTPDIIVRFVARNSPPNLQHLGLNAYSFSDDKFFFQSSQRAAKVAMPFNLVGRRCEVICENSADVPLLLIHLINVTVLTRECVPIHATAFSYKGVGVLLTGWKNGGMTEALLAFWLRGARYIGSEWILLKGDGNTMYGLPGTFTIRTWHLKHLRELHRQMSLWNRLSLKSIVWLEVLERWLPLCTLDRLLPIQLLRDALFKLKRRLHIKVEPQMIFSLRAGSLQSTVDKMFVLMTHDSPHIRVEPINPLEIAQQIVCSTCHEQLDFFRGYLAYKFAFPERAPEFIEGIPAVLEDVLRSALTGKQAYLVLHPDRVSLAALFEAMRPFCEQNLL